VTIEDLITAGEPMSLKGWGNAIEALHAAPDTLRLNRVEGTDTFVLDEVTYTPGRAYKSADAELTK
jgi:hypothetical protein